MIAGNLRVKISNTNDLNLHQSAHSIRKQSIFVNAQYYAQVSTSLVLQTLEKSSNTVNMAAMKCLLRI